jgi:acyl dehydratase
LWRIASRLAQVQAGNPPYEELRATADISAAPRAEQHHEQRTNTHGIRAARTSEAAETRIDDLPAHLGEPFGPSGWHLADQRLIDEFADGTGDHAFHHVDVERARAELRDGKSIAHGLLTLSLVPVLLSQLFRLGHSTRGLNYGHDKLRFLAPVQAGDCVRLTAVPAEIIPRAGADGAGRDHRGDRAR